LQPLYLSSGWLVQCAPRLNTRTVVGDAMYAHRRLRDGARVCTSRTEAGGEWQNADDVGAYFGELRKVAVIDPALNEGGVD
jgi:hypothetical protein